MKKRYVVSRYSGTRREIKFNVRVARYVARLVIKDGLMPVVPHIYFTQFLDDMNYYERKLGTEMGLELLKECDSALIVVIDGHISKGMKAEIKYIEEVGMPFNILSLTKAEMKALLREGGV